MLKRCGYKMMNAHPKPRNFSAQPMELDTSCSKSSGLETWCFIDSTNTWVIHGYSSTVI